MPRVPRWLPWAVAGLLALLVLVAPSTVEGLTTTHEKAVKCVEDGKVWLDGACCKAFDGATQKCRKGESTESTGGDTSSKKGKKGGTKGSKTTKTATTTTADDTQDTSGDDEVKPKGKNKSAGGGGKQYTAKYHNYHDEDGKMNNDIGQTWCADYLSSEEMAGKPWMAMHDITKSKCGKPFRVTNVATDDTMVVYAVDQQNDGGIDLDRPVFRQLDGDGAGFAAGHMTVRVQPA